MGLGILNLESSLRKFPTGGIDPWPSIENYSSAGRAFGPDKQGLSWAFQILPYLEENAVYNFNTKEQITNSPVDSYFCPNSRGPTFNDRDNAWLMDYAALAPSPSRSDFVKQFGNDRFFDRLVGVLANETGGPTSACNSAYGFWGVTSYSNDHNPDPKSSLRNYTGFNGVIVRGSYNNETGPAKDLDYDPPTTMRRLKDGTSKTAMVSEKRLRTDVAPGGPDDDRGWSDGWDIDTVRSTMCQPAQDGPSGTYDWPIFALIAGSAHDSGMNTVFADGHVQFINYEIDVETWNLMGHRDDGQTFDADF